MSDRSEQAQAAHKLTLLTPPLQTKDRRYGCSCGRWQYDEPKVGAYGHTTARAILGRVSMAHHMHLREAAGMGTLRRAKRTD